MFDWLTMDNLDTLLEFYKKMGILFGFGLTFIESFLPFLPLVVIVMANASAFGLLGGFLLSWFGTVLGAFAFFLVVRKFGKHRSLYFITQQKNVKKLIRWVDMRGITPLLVLLCLPFTPVIVVNIVAGLSNIKRLYYFITLLIGKPIMIFCMSYIGSDLREILTEPKKIIIVTCIIFAVWGIGKIFEIVLNKRVERDLREINQLRKKNM